MWDSRMPRIFILVVLCLVGMGCNKSDDVATTQSVAETTATTATVAPAPPPPPPPAEEVCTSGNTSKGKPIICVANDAKPDPASKKAWDVEKKKDGQPSSTKVTVLWLAKDETADMKVTFKDTTCVDKVEADCKKDGGECTTKLKKVTAETTCSYTIRLYDPATATGYTEETGDLIVNPCCM